MNRNLFGSEFGSEFGTTPRGKVLKRGKGGGEVGLEIGQLSFAYLNPYECILQ